MERIGSGKSFSMKGNKRCINYMLMFSLEKNGPFGANGPFTAKNDVKSCFFFTFEGVHFQDKIRESVKKKARCSSYICGH